MELWTKQISWEESLIAIPLQYSIYDQLSFRELLHNMEGSRYPFDKCEVLQALPIGFGFHDFCEGDNYFTIMFNTFNQAGGREALLDARKEVERAKEFIEYYLHKEGELDYTPTFDNLRKDREYIRSLCNLLGEDIFFRRKKLSADRPQYG